jgi:hypothetical protein
MLLLLLGASLASLVVAEQPCDLGPLLVLTFVDAGELDRLSA